MQSMAQELSYKTLAYWNLSQVWNGRIKREVTTGDAIGICSFGMEELSVSRPLSYRFQLLQLEIVQGEGVEPNPHSQVLEFPIEVKAGATI